MNAMAIETRNRQQYQDPIDEVKRYIRDHIDEPLNREVLAAGYESHAAFGKAFKQQFGLSPNEFRALNCLAATQLLLNSQNNKE